MRAVVTTAPGHMELQRRPEPRPGPDDLLVEVEAVGVCGSDYELYRGTDPYATFPLVQGHEFAGTVLELGDAYAGALRPGDRVAVEPLMPCGTCYPCRHGRGNCCVRLQVLGAHVDGALCERIAVAGDAAYPLGALDAELGALVEPMSIGMQAVTRGGLATGERVVVLGAGPIGQAVLLAARHRGAEALVVDMLDSRLTLASELGAARTVNAGADDAASAVAEWTGGDGPDVVVEATGIPAVMASALELVAASGRVVILGTSAETIAIPAILLTRKELTVVGSRNNRGVFGEAVEVVRANAGAVRRLVTHRFPLAETPAALELGLARKGEVEKIMIHVDAQGG